MGNTVLKVENLSKMYRLGQVGTGTLSHDLNRWWHKVRGKEDPYLKVGEANDRTNSGTSQYVWALKDIDFDIKEGEVVGIIGKNGAGKSTLLKILSKVTGPSQGLIQAKGRIASLLEVGTGFHPELTGRENVYLNGTILGMTKKEVDKKLDEIVDFAGVARYLDTPSKRYSSGMKVRLGFAVAAHLEPDILIVDEVLAVGDAEFQKKAIGKMKDVSQGEGRTILFVSHNMASVESLCTRGILLDKGGIIHDGEVSDTILKYHNLSTIHSDKPIRERVDRKGNGALQVTQVQARSKLEDSYSNQIITGKPFEITFSYDLSEGKPLSEVMWGFVIHKNSSPMFSCNTRFSIGRFDELKPGGKIVCHIPKLPILPGTYSLNFFVRSNSEIVDSIENAITLNIFQGPFFPNPHLPNPHKAGPFLVEHSWDYTYG